MMLKILKTVERTTDFGTIEIPLAVVQRNGVPRDLHMRIRVEYLSELAEMVDGNHYGCGRFFGRGAIQVFFVGK